MKISIPASGELREQYDALFAELADKTKESVEDLPSYFRALDTHKDSLSNKFWRIPLDEPVLEVNTDTRSISVPNAFSTTGVGVKGDANAEILWFSVPRFYDTMDLSNQSCAVQWSANKQTGVSPLVLTDTTEEELLLGWVITPEMTQESGSLEFALRFYTVDGDKNVSYSLSTQKASCVIKSTLDLDIANAKIDTDLENLIKSRPVYSNIVNSMEGVAPIFEEGGNLDSSVEYDLLTTYDDFDEYEDQYPNGIYKFTVNAKSPNGEGTLEYRWYNGKNEQQKDPISGIVDTDAEFVATVAGTYYAKVGLTNEGTGTRWVNSNSVVVPAASAIKQDSVNSNYPLGAFSDESKTFKFAVTGYNKPEDIEYTWSLNDIKQDCNEAEFTPPENSEGVLTCTAVNHRNNTSSEPITSPTAYLRAVPTSPTEVLLKSSVAGKTITLTPDPTFSGTSASHSDEWEYRWTWQYTDGATGAMITTNPESEHPEISQLIRSVSAAKTASNKDTHSFWCTVAHAVTVKLPDGTNVTETRRSKATQSNVLTFEVDNNGIITEIK